MLPVSKHDQNNYEENEQQTTKIFFEVVKTKIGLLAYVLKENTTSVTFFENVSAIS